MSSFEICDPTSREEGYLLQPLTLPQMKDFLSYLISNMQKLADFSYVRWRDFNYVLPTPLPDLSQPLLDYKFLIPYLQQWLNINHRLMIILYFELHGVDRYVNQQPFVAYWDRQDRKFHITNIDLVWKRLSLNAAMYQIKTDATPHYPPDLAVEVYSDQDPARKTAISLELQICRNIEDRVGQHKSIMMPLLRESQSEMVLKIEPPVYRKPLHSRIMKVRYEI